MELIEAIALIKAQLLEMAHTRLPLGGQVWRIAKHHFKASEADLPSDVLIGDEVDEPENRRIVDLDPLAVFTSASKPSAFALVKGSRPVQTEWPIPGGLAGLSVLVGGRGAGKTTHLVNELHPTLIIRVGEPAENPIDAMANVIHAAGMVEAFFLAIAASKAGFSVAIDGTRPLVFSNLGAATRGGVASGLYLALTNISNLAAEHGVSIVATLNPMSDEANTEFVFQNVTASVVGGWLLESGSVSKETHRAASGRTFDAMPADKENHPADGFMTIIGSGLFSTVEPALSTLRAFKGPDLTVVADEEDVPSEAARKGIRFTAFDEATAILPKGKK